MAVPRNIPIGPKFVPKLTPHNQGIAPGRGRAEQKSRAEHLLETSGGIDQVEKEARPTDQSEQSDRDDHTLCDKRWDKLMKHWGETDKLVIMLIAQAKRDPLTMFQLDGNRVKKLEADWEEVRNEEHACKKINCDEEHAKLLKITGRNMARIIPKTSQQEEKKPSQVEERKDEAYIKWKEWKSRDAQNTAERETRLEEKRRKDREWELYRECNNILEENKARWLERGRKEKAERLESERKETMSATHNKNGQNTKKSDGNQAGKRKEKKETKPEYSRRMEEKRRLEGKQRMKSNLWKQRREHN